MFVDRMGTAAAVSRDRQNLVFADELSLIIRDKRVYVRPGPVRDGNVVAANVDNRGHPLMRCEPENRPALGVVAVPARNPVDRVAGRAGGDDEVHGSRTCGQKLLPLGDPLMSRGGRYDAHGDRRPSQPVPFPVKIVLGDSRITCLDERGERFPDPCAVFGPIDNEAPWFEAAVIGHPRGDRDEAAQFVCIRARFTELGQRDRFAPFEKGEHGLVLLAGLNEGHGTFLSATPYGPMALKMPPDCGLNRFMNRPLNPTRSSTARTLGTVVLFFVVLLATMAAAAAQESVDGLPPIDLPADAANVLPDLDLPGLTSYAPANRVAPLNDVIAGELFLEAQLSEAGPTVGNGLVWRIFGAQPDNDGKLPLIATANGGAARFVLEPGSYLVHAAFGRASASARISIGAETRRETMVLNAGGLMLDASLPDGSAVRPGKLAFDIYDMGTDGERDLILPGVPPGKTVRLPAGTYHVVSRYGVVNANIRADLRVEPGKLTEAAIEHRAAQVTLNLVRTENGFPLADTAWSVIGASGEVLVEDVGAYPTMILAAGEYTAIANHRDRIYQHTFTVTAGRDVTIRVMANGLDSP